mmetsp:Transcript_89367/g.248217  ORF Transcript_89367/g.248217 Transcript_89367/m.248217 type:complete len:339 (-) Transcript_89367:2-1018(-)
MTGRRCRRASQPPPPQASAPRTCRVPTPSATKAAGVSAAAAAAGGAPTALPSEAGPTGHERGSVASGELPDAMLRPWCRGSIVLWPRRQPEARPRSSGLPPCGSAARGPHHLCLQVLQLRPSNYMGERCHPCRQRRWRLCYPLARPRQAPSLATLVGAVQPWRPGTAAAPCAAAAAAVAVGVAGVAAAAAATAASSRSAPGRLQSPAAPAAPATAAAGVAAAPAGTHPRTTNAAPAMVPPARWHPVTAAGATGARMAAVRANAAPREVSPTQMAPRRRRAQGLWLGDRPCCSGGSAYRKACGGPRLGVPERRWAAKVPSKTGGAGPRAILGATGAKHA